MADIFISYAHPDRAKIEPLVAALEGEGFSVWWDPQVVGGREYSKEIEDAISEAKAVVVAWSEHSLASTWVKDEAQIARDQGKIIPISLDGSMSPIGFKQFQQIDFTGADHSQSMPALIRAIRMRVAGEGPAAAASVVSQAAPGANKTYLIAGVAVVAMIALLAFFMIGLPKKDTPAEIATASNEVASEPALPAQSEQASIAVLPFVSMTANEEDRFFADGLTEEILNALTVLPNILVTSRTSAFQFRGEDLPPVPEIAKTLGVDYILEGSVRRAGDKVRVTVQFIRAEDDKHLWSETFDRSLDDVFAIQEDVAHNVAKLLGIVLQDNIRAMLRDSGTRNVDAFIAYQKGLDLFTKYHFEDNRRLIEADPYFAKATELEPGFSQAYLMRSDYYAHRIASLLMAPEGYDQEEFEELNSNLQPLLMAAYEAADYPFQRDLANAERIYFSDDWSKANAALDRIFSMETCATGNWEDALSEVASRNEDYIARSEQLLKCNPLDPPTRTLLGEAYVLVGRFDDAKRQLANLPEGYDTIPGLQIEIDIAMRRESDPEVFLAVGNEGYANYLRARQMAMVGDPERARQLTYDAIRPSESLLMFQIAAMAVIGDREEANRLAAIVDSRPMPGFILGFTIHICKCGAPFDISATPNFAAQMEAAGFPWPPAGDIGFPMKDW